MASEMSQPMMLPLYSQLLIDTYLINYIKIGYGPILIFAFPGIMAPLKSSFMPLFALMLSDPNFCANYTFYGWDEPGYFGSSAHRRKIDDISFDKDVELAHALLTRLSSSKFVILGYSGGSQAAIAFSLKYPGSVQKLILLGGWDRFDEEEVRQNPWYRDVTNVPGPFAAMLEKEFDGNRELMLKHWIAWHDAIMKQYSNTDKEAWRRRYDHFTIPTLIVWGKQDTIVPWKQTAELHKAIKHSQLVVIPRAPHNAHLAFPDKFFKILNAFLEEPLTNISQNKSISFE